VDGWAKVSSTCIPGGSRRADNYLPRKRGTKGERVIQVIGYSKTYRDLTAVWDLSFEVRAGAILGLVGPNGAGKTTTLRALAGIIPPTRGRLIVAGHDVVAEPLAAKRRLAYVPDEPRLFDTLTVWEHLVFIASAYSVDDFEPKAQRLLDAFELAEKRDTIAQELSRGMRQKVAIACAYLHDPRAILFDEPLTGLDPHAIRVLKASIVARAAEGAAVVVSSHLLALVENLCTDLLILQKGRAVYCGPMAGARQQFGALGEDVSLEDVFFRAIEGPAS
jgi:ABC-2 type transport system ATP-binding protein